MLVSPWDERTINEYYLPPAPLAPYLVKTALLRGGVLHGLELFSTLVDDPFTPELAPRVLNLVALFDAEDHVASSSDAEDNALVPPEEDGGSAAVPLGTRDCVERARTRGVSGSLDKIPPLLLESPEPERVTNAYALAVALARIVAVRTATLDSPTADSLAATDRELATRIFAKERALLSEKILPCLFRFVSSASFSPLVHQVLEAEQRHTFALALALLAPDRFDVLIHARRLLEDADFFLRQTFVRLLECSTPADNAGSANYYTPDTVKRVVLGYEKSWSALLMGGEADQHKHVVEDLGVGSRGDDLSVFESENLTKAHAATEQRFGFVERERVVAGLVRVPLALELRRAVFLFPRRSRVRDHCITKILAGRGWKCVWGGADRWERALRG